MQTTTEPNTLKRRSALVGAFLMLNWLCLAQAATLLTSPFIFVHPTTLDFGRVPLYQSATNTLVVENVGSGVLEGKVTVAAPFRILSGETYKLERNAAQVVTIVYTPNGAPTNVQVVAFFGKDHDARAAVIGRMSKPLRPKYLPRK
jgi:hypothetical protein